MAHAPAFQNDPSKTNGHVQPLLQQLAVSTMPNNPQINLTTLLDAIEALEAASAIALRLTDPYERIAAHERMTVAKSKLRVAIIGTGVKLDIHNQELTNAFGATK